MGIICPVCLTHQPQSAVLDADGSSPKRSEDAVVIKLGCGHSVGTEKAKAFMDAVAVRRAEHQAARDKLQSQYQKDIVGIWNTMKESE